MTEPTRTSEFRANFWPMLGCSLWIAALPFLTALTLMGLVVALVVAFAVVLVVGALLHAGSR